MRPGRTSRSVGATLLALPLRGWLALTHWGNAFQWDELLEPMAAAT